MRPPSRSVTPAVVRDLAARHPTDALPRAATRTVPVDQLLRLPLLVATGATSPFDVVRRRFPFTHHAACRAALRLSRLDRRRRWVVAVDTHLVPYYGRRTGAVGGGPRKAGTAHFHGSATAALVGKGRRYAAARSPPPPATGRTTSSAASSTGSRPAG